MAMFMLESGMRCVDNNGCIREHCCDFNKEGLCDISKFGD